MAQLYFAEHDGTVSTTALVRDPQGKRAPDVRCVSFKVDAHKVGTPDVDGADLLTVAGVTDTPQTCEACRPKRAPKTSDPE